MVLRLPSPYLNLSKKKSRVLNWWRWMMRNMEVWGIMVSTFFQDGPFLAIRLYVMIKHSVISYMMIFFTCKNTLVSTTLPNFLRDS